MAANHNIEGNQGETLNLHILYTDTDDSGIDLSSYVAEMQVRRSSLSNDKVLHIFSGTDPGGVTAGITVERGPLGYNNSNYPNTPDMVLDSTVNYTGGIQPGDVITYGFYSTGSQQLVGTNPVVEYISVGVKSNEVQHISIKSICLVRSGT